MSKIKINELPEIRYNNVNDDDICIIENFQDTYKIPVSDLKIIFSNDNKINGIYTSLLNRINDLSLSLAENTNKYDEWFNKIEYALNENIINNINRLIDENIKIKQQLESNKNDIIEIMSLITGINLNINNINSAIENLNERVQLLENDNTTNKTNISNNTNNISTNKTNISSNTKDIEQLKKDLANINAVSKESITELDTKLKELINQKYDELLKLIDQYGHLNPILI